MRVGGGGVLVRVGGGECVGEDGRSVLVRVGGECAGESGRKGCAGEGGKGYAGEGGRRAVCW